VRTIIVGGGLGGLSAAIHLAVAGERVLLLEKNERVGGKLNIFQREGYTWDTGPSLFTMPWVLRELFEAAGRRLEDALEIVPVEPTCRYRWPDGARFDAFQFLPRLVQEVQRLSPPDVPALFRFLEHTSKIYDAVAPTFLLKPYAGLRELITPQLMRHALRIDALRTVDGAVRAFFRSPRLRQVFNRYATYNGSSPYLSPATFNLIAYIEFAEGGWYVRGGMYEIARALERLARDLGVEIRTGAEVEEILAVDSRGRGARRRVCGVRLAGGATIEAERVVVNADPRYAYARLLPGEARAARRLARLPPSCSGFIMLLGVDHIYEQLEHHNIFFSADYEREFAAIFAKGVPAPDPTVYVCASCVSDPQHAPPGHMNLFVLVNAPSVGSAPGRSYSWLREAEGYGDAVLRKLERMGLGALRSHVTTQTIITPEELERRYNAAGGAIYGPASNDAFAAFARPPQRARELGGLYFVGGGTHPGGGIPLVLLSGRAVAQHIAADSL
jgi:phytoene desaturase